MHGNNLAVFSSLKESRINVFRLRCGRKFLFSRLKVSETERSLLTDANTVQCTHSTVYAQWQEKVYKP